jgi:hypothetical protein
MKSAWQNQRFIELFQLDDPPYEFEEWYKYDEKSAAFRLKVSMNDLQCEGRDIIRAIVK